MKYRIQYRRFHIDHPNGSPTAIVYGAVIDNSILLISNPNSGHVMSTTFRDGHLDISEDMSRREALLGGAPSRPEIRKYFNSDVSVIPKSHLGVTIRNCNIDYLEALSLFKIVCEGERIRTGRRMGKRDINPIARYRLGDMAASEYLPHRVRNLKGKNWEIEISRGRYQNWSLDGIKVFGNQAVRILYGNERDILNEIAVNVILADRTGETLTY